MSTAPTALAEIDYDKFREYTCIRCDRALTVADVKAALARNPQSEPGQIYCRRKTCEALEDRPGLDSVNEIPPRPEGGVVTVPSDLSDEPKLARIRREAGLPLEKSDRDIAQGLRELVPPPNQCEHHNDPRTCSVCGTDKLANPIPRQNQKERDRQAAQLKENGWGGTFRTQGGKGTETSPAPGPDKELSLEEEVQKILKRRKLKNTPAKPSRRERKVLGDRIHVLLDKERGLRLEYGLSRRQLADILDNKDFKAPFQVNDEEFGRTDPKFRRWFLEIQNGMGKTRYKTISKGDGVFTFDGKVLLRPGTLAQWRTMLPLKWVTCVTEAEKSFYRDYANCNLTKAEMKAKYGEVSDENIRLLENRIVRRGFYLKLFNSPIGGIPLKDFERDRDRAWELETQAIARGISYVGSIFGSNRPGSRKTRLATPPMVRSKQSGDDGEESGMVEDEYGEESGS
jgi:hypothetical protein